MTTIPENLPVEFKEIATICTATEVSIGGRTVIGVADARDLYLGLGVGKDYTTWIKGRIARYGFQEGIDFIVPQNGGTTESTTYEGAKTAQTYRVTLDMAKELAMVENNERGRVARRYFIWAEEVARGLISGDLTFSEEQRSVIGGIVKGSVNKALVPVTEGQLATNNKVDALALGQAKMEAQLGKMMSDLRAVALRFNYLGWSSASGPRSAPSRS